MRRLANRITVLRDGKRIVTREAEGVDEDEMVRLMVGRNIERVELPPLEEGAPEILRVEGLSVEDPDRPDGRRLSKVSLILRRGEILGLAGLIGAGRTDLLLALAGALERPVSGRVLVDGAEYRPSTPAEARDAGVVLLPEERKSQAIFPDLAVSENVTVGLAAEGLSPRVDRQGERQGRRRVADARHGRACGLAGGPDRDALRRQPAEGGARALPVRLAVGPAARRADARASTWPRRPKSTRCSAGSRREGFGIILCSSEMSEILTQCHRVLVFREGRVTAELPHAEATEERVLAAAAGTTATDRREETGRAAVGRTAGPAGRRRLARFTGLFGLAAVLVLSIVFSPVRGGRPVFLDVGNLTDILRQVAEKGILAVGMTAVIISGGIDLSVGSVLALSATLTAWLLMKAGLGLGAAILVVLAVGALWGAVNGFVVARWRLQPFIATLATMSAARGVARYLSGGAAIPLGFGRGRRARVVARARRHAAPVRAGAGGALPPVGRRRCTCS